MVFPGLEELHLHCHGQNLQLGWNQEVVIPPNVPLFGDTPNPRISVSIQPVPLCVDITPHRIQPSHILAPRIEELHIRVYGRWRLPQLK